jgi:hypothetical protein
MRTFPRISLAIILLVVLSISLAFGWTEPKRITCVGALDARAVAEDRTLHVVGTHGWTDFYYLNSWNNGYSWGQPINPADTFYSSFLADVICSKGLLHIVWSSDLLNAPDQAYHISSSDDGRTWSVPHPIFRNPLDGIVNYPRLAANGDTLFLSCLKYYTLLFRSFDRGVTWGDSIAIDTQASVINYPPTILFADGRLHLIYQANYYNDSLGIEIFYCRSEDYGLTWSDKITLSTAERIPNYVHSQFPSAYADSDGHIVVAWFDYKYGSYCGYTGDILARVSTDNGMTWLPESRITDTQSGEASSGIILNDVIHLVWMDSYPMGCDYPKIMHSQSSDWGASWTEPEVVSGPTQRYEHAPMLFSNIILGQTYLHCVMDVNFPGYGPDLFYFRDKSFYSTHIPMPHNDNILSIKAYPNVLNSSTMISIDNSEGGDVELEIYNVLGQMVWLKSMDGKEGNITWDARDMEGNGISSGTYFVRATSQNNTSVIKLIYLK